MSLSDFSGLEERGPDETQEAEAVSAQVEQALPVVKPPLKKPRKKTIQTELSLEHHRWLVETAEQIRSNSTEPTPPDQRCYPQHLISVAIDMLQASGLDWTRVQGVKNLRKQLGLEPNP
ncbi:hypothetical protein [Anthocerotibacter panamensis]|uniref:hypothetical protein n=1 Tax=Anthocerotibacter panamensis TaxID=2857077 RepID=UPI001C4022CE|nr:hypothetical protein [Anthocerotibacter panamensis]